VTVNGIAPGPVEGTEGMSRLSKVTPSKDQLDNKNGFNEKKENHKVEIPEMNQTVPILRIVDKREIAWMCLYLSSSMARAVTGTKIVVDGGMILSNSNWAVIKYREMYSQGILSDIDMRKAKL